jgi:hypothetical protein
MKHAGEMSPGAMIYIQSFTEDWFRHSTGGGRRHTYTHTHTEQGDLISLPLPFENMESRSKNLVLSIQ